MVLYGSWGSNQIEFRVHLLDMYSKCSCVEEAWLMFEYGEIFDEVSVTVMLSGFTQNGF